MSSTYDALEVIQDKIRGLPEEQKRVLVRKAVRKFASEAYAESSAIPSPAYERFAELAERKAPTEDLMVACLVLDIMPPSTRTSYGVRQSPRARAREEAMVPSFSLVHIRDAERIANEAMTTPDPQHSIRSAYAEAELLSEDGNNVEVSRRAFVLAHAVMFVDAKIAGDKYPRMTTLCAKFPSLHGVDGASPFEATKLARHVVSSSSTAASRFAVAFVLSVFDDAAWAPVLPFSLVPALAVWDRHHYDALMSYMKHPWSQNDR